MFFLQNRQKMQSLEVSVVKNILIFIKKERKKERKKKERERKKERKIAADIIEF